MARERQAMPQGRQCRNATTRNGGRLWPKVLSSLTGDRSQLQRTLILARNNNTNPPQKSDLFFDLTVETETVRSRLAGEL